jgi:hemerythrin-like domain-containing protein
MKRHAALRGLSSDHHLGLVQARRLIRAAGLARREAVDLQTAGATVAEAIATEAEKVARDFLIFWGEHTTRHFREEEEVLLPMFARYGDPSQIAIVQVLVEHIHIRRLVFDLQQQLETHQPPQETMRSVGELLRAHIRHEENVVFPLIEAAMPEEARQALSSQLDAASMPGGMHMAVRDSTS